MSEIRLPVLLLLLVLLCACDRSEQTVQESFRQECRQSMASRRDEYDKLIEERKYWDASLALRNCSIALDDQDLKRLVSDAEIRSHHSDIESPSLPAAEKLRAYESLLRDYPAEASRYSDRLEAIQRQARVDERKAADLARTAEAKRRKSEGVVIGMTEDDVLASSWGKPKHINRTTTAYGVREQWVYGGKNFLYFEDGKLVAIQN